MVYRNPVYHQIVFASLIITTALRITYILQLSDASQRIPAKAKKTITHFFSTGAALFALGFLIWNVDNIFCHTLTTWKVSIGWPIAFLLEGQFLFPLIVPAYTLTFFGVSVIGHSWWHVLTVRLFFLFSSLIIFSRSDEINGRVLGLITNSLASNVRLLRFHLFFSDGLADLFPRFMFYIIIRHVSEKIYFILSLAFRPSPRN